MLNVDDVNLVRGSQLNAGDFVLLTDDDVRGSTVVLMAPLTGSLTGFRVPDLQVMSIDDDDYVLRIVNPEIRFDPQSAIPAEDELVRGALVYYSVGPAIYYPSGTNTRPGKATTLRGVRNDAWRDGAPAFARWDLGIVRDGKFEVLAAADLA